jgi:hypothetical protein
VADLVEQKFPGAAKLHYITNGLQTLRGVPEQACRIAPTICSGLGFVDESLIKSILNVYVAFAWHSLGTLRGLTDTQKKNP